MTTQAFAFSDEELERVLDAHSAPSSPPTGVVPSERSVAPSAAAIDLARVLGASYVEVVARVASEALLGRALRHGDHLRRVVDHVSRLAAALEDQSLIGRNAELPQIVEMLLSATGPESRRVAGQGLRDWVLGYASEVGGDAGLRLRRRMLYRRGMHPFITHLREIRGVGERRLDRLHRAGLLTHDALAEARPDELAKLAGISKKLAQEIIDTSRRHCRDERIQTIKVFRTLADDVQRALREAGPDPALRHGLVSAVRATMADLAALLTDLGQPEASPDELE